MHDSTPYRLDPLDTGSILLLSTELVDGRIPSATGAIEKEKLRISREIHQLERSCESLGGAALVVSLQVDHQNAQTVERIRRMRQSVNIWIRLQGQIDHLRTQLDTGMQMVQLLRENILLEEQMIHSLQLKALQHPGNAASIAIIFVVITIS
ncbi:hypothetical protein EWM64_g4961 [Hericium alpestre]|uniref:Uncharacterized protein n=1 Tax=Hericium alpestre TaxID=135208 RepID=A0A4Y9ZW55_9AGAM|nr:hypothetical protein EWM64_g4961 [Hericium alpestre]